MTYDGEYSRGERNGPGILRNENGTVVFDGLWKEGKKVLSTEGTAKGN
jgi:hypothetical protein